MTPSTGLLSLAARARVQSVVAGLVASLVGVHLAVIAVSGVRVRLAFVVVAGAGWLAVALWALLRRDRLSTREVMAGWALGATTLTADGIWSGSPHHDLLCAVGLTGVAIGVGFGSAARDAAPVQVLVITCMVLLVLGTEGTGWFGLYVAGTAAAVAAAICAVLGWVDHGRRTAVTALAAAALTDPLTGLSNRRGLAERFPGLCRAARPGTLPTVIAVDLDHFKSVNDRLGHDGGDQVLVAVAAVLRASARADDLLVRLGGEELAWVGTWPSAAEALASAERVRRTVAATTLPGGVVVTLSAGVALDGRHAAGPGGAEALAGRLSQLLLRADHALYAAKDAGRDRVVLAPDAGAAPTGGRPGGPEPLLSSGGGRVTTTTG